MGVLLGSSSGYPDLREGLPGELEMALHILADDGFLMVTPDIVPLDAVAVEVVQHSHARLGLAVL